LFIIVEEADVRLFLIFDVFSHKNYKKKEFAWFCFHVYGKTHWKIARVKSSLVVQIFENKEKQKKSDFEETMMDRNNKPFF
jgi:hypothetical protein